MIRRNDIVLGSVSAIPSSEKNINGARFVSSQSVNCLLQFSDIWILTSIEFI